ncbi:hypothetical protein [Micromonospora vulcania]|uniref:Tight adherence protein B n=1 Tax=Micromonospora vulcania TaxID=1441873 RepID=A0ABW1HCG9_9ACTN
MSGATVLVAALLLAAATLVAWPVHSIRARRRRVLTAGGGGEVGADVDDALLEWVRELGRTPDGPASGLGSPPASGHLPIAVGYGGGRTAVGWPVRDATGAPSWPRGAGGSARSTRPAGPVRPPSRRDPRRPTGTAGPVTEAPDTERAATTSVIENADPQADVRGGTPEMAGGRGDVDDRHQHRHDTPAVTAGGASVGTLMRVPSCSARLLLLVGLAGAGVGAVLGGPVAAAAVGGYGTLTVRSLLRWRVNRHAEQIRRRGLDQLCGLAADLRAGLPVPPTVEIATTGAPDGSDRLRQLTSAAVRLADRTGAPLAELVERIEADARATDRGLAAAAAQAAGARATAWLLAGLPIGGIGLGYGIGVDPVAVLLHSTIGGVCAVLAVALQIVGLFWTERLGAAPGRAA